MGTGKSPADESRLRESCNTNESGVEEDFLYKDRQLLAATKIRTTKYLSLNQTFFPVQLEQDKLVSLRVAKSRTMTLWLTFELAVPFEIEYAPLQNKAQQIDQKTSAVLRIQFNLLFYNCSQY